jgi:uncharacterized protein with GYD domain/quercetin dioxygenase-like cupin family protein
MKSITSGSLVLFLMAVFCMNPMPGRADTAHESKKGSVTMHTYVIFFGFTGQGIQKIKDSPARVEAAKQTVRSMGGEIKAFFGILGSQFDTMFILEAPDDETVAKMVLSIASGGNVRTETHRLFTEDEYTKIISALPGSADVAKHAVIEKGDRDMKYPDIMEVAPKGIKVLFENDRVRVLDARREPGAIEPEHSHPPYVVYVLSDASQKITTPDGKVVEKHLKAGQVLWSEAVTHSVVYMGKTEAHILAVELKK